MRRTEYVDFKKGQGARSSIALLLTRAEERDVSKRDHMGKSEQRIHAVRGDDNERTAKNARRYFVHLKKQISLPLCVTGIEDFPWEKPYMLGGWDRRPYFSARL